MYIQVNIGRNVLTMPMGEKFWNAFQEDVVRILDGYREHSDMGHEVPEIHLGTGVWDGRVEESAKISLYHEGGFDLDGIREQLRQLKLKYLQDNIALIIGSELV